MASKQVRDECKTGDAVVAAGRAWAGEIASRRAAQLTGLGLGGPQVEAAIGQAIECDMCALATRGQRLQDADTALDEAESVAPGVLARRDEASQRAYNGLVQLREVVSTFAGAEAARALGFAGATPRDPVAVEGLIGRVLARLATAKLVARVPGLTLDLAQSIAEFTGHHGALARANADALTAKRGAQLTRSRRDALWTDYTLERCCAGARLVADLRAVGLTDVAERLLPTVRKGSPTAEVTDPTKAAAPTEAKAKKKADAKAKKKGKKNAEEAPAPVATKAEEAPAVVTPAINTRPSVAPAQPS